ncbi:hypothetical protein KRR40_15410 [Niabella defluvii]|nr:hypothetical protein KRR40_15410 [Niabella sp. I65]
MQNGSEVKELKGGKTTILRVEVTARADAEYVMVEVPIRRAAAMRISGKAFGALKPTGNTLKKNLHFLYTAKPGQVYI